MNKACWWLIEFVCQALQVEEREAVLGDLAESGHSAIRSLSDAASLIVRRQFGLWRDWRPWVALVAVGGVSAVPLSRMTWVFGGSLGQQISTYRHYGVRFETGLTFGQDIAYLTCLSAALFLWSWVSGFALGSLSGRAIWLTGATFYLVVLDAFRMSLLLSGNIRFFPWWPMSAIVLSLLLPFSIHAILFLATAIWGMRQGLQLRTLALSRAVTMAAVISVLTALIVWMDGWYQTVQEIYSAGAWHGPPWFARLPPLLLMTWPVWYLLASSQRQPGELKHEVL